MIVLIPLERECIYPGTSEGDALLQQRKKDDKTIPLVIGSGPESEILVPNGTPVGDVAYMKPGKTVGMDEMVDLEKSIKAKKTQNAKNTGFHL